MSKIRHRRMMFICMCGAACWVMIGSMGCGRGLPGKLKGRWQISHGEGWMEFTRDGKVKGTLRHVLESGVSPAHSAEGVHIERGFQLVKYAGEEVKSGYLKRGRTGVDEELPVKWYVRGPANMLWCKVAIASEKSEKLTLVGAVRGTPVEGYRIAEPGVIGVRVRLGTQDVEANGLSFNVQYVDTNLNWCGELELDSAYESTGERSFAILAPLAGDQDQGRLVLYSGSLDGGRIVLNGRLEGLKGGTFERREGQLRSPGVPNENLMDIRKLPGVEVDEGVFVNRGETVGRLQKVRFLLPEEGPSPTIREGSGKESAGDQGEELMASLSPGASFLYNEDDVANHLPPLTIEKGVGGEETIHAYEKGVVAPGQVLGVAANLAGMTMFLPFKLEKENALKFSSHPRLPKTVETDRIRYCYLMKYTRGSTRSGDQ